MKWIQSVKVYHAEKGRLNAESPECTYGILFERLILATGARERFLPFPGWTLPNVLGVGGLQALIKSGLSVKGKRIVLAGTGPLLLAVAAHIQEHDGEVVCIAEQTSRTKFTKFGMKMLVEPGKFREAMRLVWRLKEIPHWKNSWPIAALGRDRLEAVRLVHQGEIREVECDYLGCGFHLIPNTELAEYLGCELQDGFVAVDDRQQTSLPGVYCAGEPTGIGGLDLALIEGQIAGEAVAKNKVDKKLFEVRAANQRVVRALKEAFALRTELKALAQADTLLCRCEDVPFGSVRGCKSWREAKLQTRCGMGPCQGKVCGPATGFLFGWKADCGRPPLFPVRCGSLAAISSNTVQVQPGANGG